MPCNAVVSRKILSLSGCVLIAVAAAAEPARAQGTILHAIVADANTGDYILDASVSVDPIGLKGITDFFGDARFASLKKGRYTVHVRRIGYAPNDLDVRLSGRDSLEVTLMMMPLTYQLAPVKVEESVTSTFLREFEDRRKRATGYYLTDSVLRKSLGSPLGFIIEARVPGVVYLQQLGTLSSTRGPNNFKSGTWCPITVYWNGVRTESQLSNIPVDFVGGVEFYNPGNIPVQYRWPGSGCGVLLLWPRP
jgi:hypothetical protein